MKTYYELIINGNLQKTISFKEKADALNIIAYWKANGRLTDKDKVAIRTTIVIEDEVKL